jgi:acyl-CoA thioesterase-2
VCSCEQSLAKGQSLSAALIPRIVVFGNMLCAHSLALRRGLASLLSSSAPLSPTPINFVHQDISGCPNDLYSSGPDTFLADTHTLWTPKGARGVYGGHVLATAMLAAERTLPGLPGAQFPMSSCHGYFLRPGNSALPTSFTVERLRDGKSFITRSVTVRQKGEAIFTLLASFHCMEQDASGGVLGHQVAMPSVPSPDQCQEAQGSSTLVPAYRHSLPLLVLPCTPRDYNNPTPAWPAKAAAWMRVAPLPPPTPLTAHLHRAALAFASDWGIGIASLLPYNLTWNSPQIQIAASLDHAMYFHDSLGGDAPQPPPQAAAGADAGAPRIVRHPSAPPSLLAPAPPQRADDWVLFEMESSVLRGGAGDEPVSHLDKGGDAAVHGRSGEPPARKVGKLCVRQ